MDGVEGWPMLTARGQVMGGKNSNGEEGELRALGRPAGRGG